MSAISSLLAPVLSALPIPKEIKGLLGKLEGSVEQGVKSKQEGQQDTAVSETSEDKDISY